MVGIPKVEVSLYAILWQFKPKSDAVNDFEKAYGSNGLWAEFFKKSPEYFCTMLLSQKEGNYLTLDLWKSEQAYREFLETNQREYHELDEQCSSLTESEIKIGEYSLIGGADVLLSAVTRV